MANLNDFKNVNSRSKRYGEYLKLQEKHIKKNASRFGFYLLILECVTNIKELNELTDMIIDTEFRSIIFNEKNNDQGVDAVNIDYDNKNIQLFNFKYREKFKPDAGQDLNAMSDVNKFLLYIENENIAQLDKTTREKIEEIINLLNSDDIWNIELFMISNENNPISSLDPNVEQFKQAYGMEVRSITLDDIVSYISDFPEDVSSTFSVDKNSVMTYEIDELSTKKSYLIKLPLTELIRITCTDKDLRLNPTVDYSKLKDKKLEMSLLFDNVRGYLGSNKKFNKSIQNTIKNNPTSFFMFNNGITMTAKTITAEYKNGKKKFECTLNGYQIVNGGQTLRTIYEFAKHNFDEEALSSSEILIRIFQTESDKKLTNEIAEYTNSQNAISSIDLKSINNLQIQIGTYLKSHNILYVRKSGDVGENNSSYVSRISMEKLAQIIYSELGYPDRATNQKNALFEKYYDEIFNNDLDFETLISLITDYNSIDEQYKNLTFTPSHQKYLYIIYMMKQYPSNSIEENINKLEDLLDKYKNDVDISPARKLIQTGFKDFIKENL